MFNQLQEFKMDSNIPAVLQKERKHFQKRARVALSVLSGHFFLFPLHHC